MTHPVKIAKFMFIILQKRTTFRISRARARVTILLSYNIHLSVKYLLQLSILTERQGKLYKLYINNKCLKPWSYKYISL